MARKMKHTPQKRKQTAPHPRSTTVSPVKVAEGIFSGTQSGYGFVKVAGEEEDIFIPAEKTYGAIDGDRVAIRYHKFRRDGGVRTEGTVTKIIEIGRTTVIGTVVEEILWGRRRPGSSVFYVVPDDPHLNFEVVLTDPAGCKMGDKVEVSLNPRKSHMATITGTLLRNFGKASSREANYAVILLESGITVDFTEEELKQAEEMAALPISPAGRTDRRHEVIFTIDGADAKDLDDAISLSQTPEGNYLLGVHIANVSHYVREHTPLDEAVMARGTSVYFTDQVVPMLPPALSNGACSLNANEDKYALSALIELSPTGDILSTKVERSIIRSVVRGVYSEVNDLFQNGEASPFYDKYSVVYPTLLLMHQLYLILAKKGKARGAMDLEQEEAVILLNENGFPTDILPRERGDGEKLIEQFMLAANEGVATLLFSRSLPCVYRVHEAPQPEKLADFATFAHNLGFDTSYITKKDPTGCDFSRLLDDAKEKGVGSALSYNLLRAMAKAHYSEVCHPHFGLGIERYCHFTSPIRRLSDLATHRMIEAVLLDGEPKGKYYAYAQRAAQAASETELKALTAERRIEALYKTLYLSKHLGEVFLATISSVTKFGVFATLDNTCEGLIPLLDLPGAWTFDEGTLSLRSSRGERLTISQRITVSVEEADVTRGKVRFGFVKIESDPIGQDPSPKAQTPRYTPKPKPKAPPKYKGKSSHSKGKKGKGKRKR